ncbi:hypothetical protein CROQUDRAFT_664285 [Cronartium quercuum f. sp. fusiforme G11]|uniref:Uncharacterized protein n=1 Tax=Cronartium quercuum f. sp. fusiforme G11 TaxID=708437 RepID=A0A9P6NCA9_9BASI|nr:hypothetical protein CROQUDRAFT_664285 [Cronartium quercuum f. sp. fusiforme G11]
MLHFTVAKLNHKLNNLITAAHTQNHTLHNMATHHHISLFLHTRKLLESSKT